jgi:hypothetical protein
VNFLFIGGPKHGQVLDVGSNDNKNVEIPHSLNYPLLKDGVHNMYRYELKSFTWRSVQYPIYVYLSLSAYDMHDIVNMLIREGFMQENAK